jgi:hypothetical protein
MSWGQPRWPLSIPPLLTFRKSPLRFAGLALIRRTIVVPVSATSRFTDQFSGAVPTRRPILTLAFFFDVSVCGPQPSNPEGQGYA